MNNLIVIPTEEVKKERVSVKGHLEAKPKQYEAEQKEVSKNIQKFDRKVRGPRVFTENPYSYNAVSLKKDRPDVAPTQSAQSLITDPVYNTIGKFLGVDTVHDWNKEYDKVYAIVEWARKESSKKDINGLIKWIGDKSNRIPNVGNKNIDNLYIFAGLYLNKK